MTQFTSVAIAVVEHDARFLVGRRAKCVPLGGFWEFPGGKIEEDESPQKAAERECLEETGIDVLATRCMIVNLQQYEHSQVKLYWYSCQLRDPDPNGPLVQPTPPYQWVSRKELADLEFPVGNQAILQQLLDR